MTFFWGLVAGVGIAIGVFAYAFICFAKDVRNGL